MADFITIRHPSTLEERDIAPEAAPFFPGWVELDKAGRVKGNQTTTTTKTEN